MIRLIWNKYLFVIDLKFLLSLLEFVEDILFDNKVCKIIYLINGGIIN